MSPRSIIHGIIATIFSCNCNFVFCKMHDAFHFQSMKTVADQPWQLPTFPFSPVCFHFSWWFLAFYFGSCRTVCGPQGVHIKSQCSKMSPNIFVLMMFHKWYSSVVAIQSKEIKLSSCSNALYVPNSRNDTAWFKWYRCSTVRWTLSATLYSTLSLIA